MEFNAAKIMQQPEWTGCNEIVSSDGIITKCGVFVVLYSRLTVYTRGDYCTDSQKTVLEFFHLIFCHKVSEQYNPGGTEEAPDRTELQHETVKF